MSWMDSGRLGPVQRFVRLAVGAVLVGFAAACPFAARLGAPVQWVSGLAGAGLLASAAAGFCPLTALLRRRSGG
jgi:hypothetical protein